MNALERLAATGGNGVGAYSFVDADTVSDGKANYRIQGLDAPEIAGFKGGEWTGGTTGGVEANNAIQKLMTEQGFTNMEKLYNDDGTPMMDATGSRQMVRFKNKNGEDFTTKLLASGALRTTPFSDQDDLDAIETERAFGDMPEEFSMAAQSIFDMISGAQNENIRFKQAARNKQQYAQNPDFYTKDVSFYESDRDFNNQSLSPLSDNWNQGWLGVQEGAYGMLELLGEETNSEWMQQIGEDGITRARANQQDYAETLLNYKDVDSFGSAMQFLGNNMAMSLPYMVTTAAGAVVGAGAAALTGGGAAVALGVGLTAPASVYAGQTWNEMEGEAHEKNAAVAVGAGLVQASLDRLGLGGLAGKLVPDRAFQQGVKHIMDKQGVSKQAAEEILSNATRNEAKGLMRDAMKISQTQIGAKQITIDLLKRAAVDGGAEAATEMMQEATAYTAAKLGGTDGLAGFDFSELNERLISAAVAGGALGGVISTPGAIKQSINEADIIYGGELATDDTASISQQYAEQERREKGYVPSIDEELLQLPKGAGFETQRDRADRYRASQKQKSFTDRAIEAALNPSALWRGATRNIFTDDIKARSRTARIAADMFGANLQKTFNGADFETFKHLEVAKYKNMFTEPKKLYSILGRGQRMTGTKKQQVSEAVYSKLNKAVDAEGKFDPNLIPDTDPDKAILVQVGNELNAMSDAMYADQKKYNPELGYIKNYLFKYKTMDKQAVKKNRIKFQGLLESEFKMNKNDAKNLTDEIIGNVHVGDIDDAFSVVKGGIVPGAHKKRSLGLSEKAAFQEFMEQDIAANVAQAAKSAARYTAHRKYIGKDGEVISALLDKMKDEGLTDAEVDKIAAQMQDYLDAESGNYKRPTSEAGKKAQTIQKNLMMVMTMAGLPLATISSFVELALANRGLTSDQVWGKQGSMKSMGTELAKTLRSGMAEVAGATIRKDTTDFDPESAARTKLKELGFYDWDVGAATVTGVTEVNAVQQKLYEGFFQATGLTGWTNYTRAVRASMGADFLLDNAEIYWKYKVGEGEYTRDVQAAEEKLRNLGIDVDRFAEVQTKITAGAELTPEEQTFFNESTKLATFNFVNEAVALPQSANRPLIYQDPRFALFTQFQGFIATFTANHIPKLWGEYVKRGTPAMKYNAFATMATMIMLGFASQALKDWIKYESLDSDDEELYEDKTGHNPYLDRPEYIRRGLMSSGLIGVAERPLSFAFPIYESRSDNAADWAFNTAVGESPALSWLQRAANATGHAVKGDLGRASEQAGKLAPGLGPFSAVNKKIGESFGDWNFSGE